MAAHLSGGRVNLAILRENYRRELLDILDKCTGNKAVVWDDGLTGPFGLIAEYSLLKEHDVDKMYSLRAGRLPSSTVQNIIFIVRPKNDVMELVAQNVLKEEESISITSARKEFHIVFVPRKSLLCEKKLKELGVYGAFTNIEEFCLDLIPFDSDLLSMEAADSFKECYLYNDQTSLFHAAKSIMTLQALYGIIPSIHGKGDLSKQVCDMLLRMRREMAGQEAQIPPQIDNLLLFDRTIDPLTPLLSQLTYEGLIDDIFSIQNTSVRLPAEKFTRTTANGETSQPVSADPKKVILHSGEELYAEIRDRNFNAVAPLLSRKAKLITAQFDERLAAKTVGEMKQFVSKLPHIQAAKQSLATHTTIAELVKEVTDSDEFLESLRVQQEFINGIETDKAHPFIEDCIAKQEPILKVLRLICIQSICNNGLKIKLLDYYKREIIQTYGFKHIVTLMNLEKAGLLKVQGQKTYPTIRKTLRLVVEEVHEQNPNDISYVFSGFAPLSIRLAQLLARPGWRSIEEVLSMLPGQRFHRVQQIADGLRKRRNSISSSNSSNQEQNVTLIFFLGGITYAEIAALRFLSQADDGPTDYIIATTKIINTASWIGSLMEELEPPVSNNPFL